MPQALAQALSWDSARTGAEAEAARLAGYLGAQELEFSWI